jgi:hypothetical protein
LSDEVFALANSKIQNEPRVATQFQSLRMLLQFVGKTCFADSRLSPYVKNCPASVLPYPLQDREGLPQLVLAANEYPVTWNISLIDNLL